MTGRRAWPEGERTGEPPPLPDDFGVVLDAAARRPGPTTIVGGRPVVAARLSPDGAAVLDGLAAGSTVAEVSTVHPSAGRFARWLVDTGIGHPRPPDGDVPAVTVVIPVRDRAAAIERLVRSLATTAPVVVVDDGSTDGTAAVAARAGARVVRRAESGGPAAARNAGLRAVDTELVAFVDSDCVPAPGSIDRLRRHFGDPLVAVAAPRIVALDPNGGVGRYEGARSVLDQGPDDARIDPFGPVTFVPSAALVVRRAAVTGAGSFDEALHFGEDQDLVWRLARDGWRMRYDAAARVAHDHRDDLGAFVRRRFGYGTPIASLAARHPDVVTAARLPAPVASALALAPMRPMAGAAVAAGAGAVVGHRLHALGISWPEAARLTANWEAGATRTALAAVTGPWLPVAVAAAVASRRARVTLLALLAVRHANDWRRSGAAVGPARHFALRVADDAALAAGRWWGAARARSLGGLGAQLLALPAHGTAPLVTDAVVLR